MLMVHFVAAPTGTANTHPFKFVSPETLEQVGGPEKFAQAADVAVSKLGMPLREPERVTVLVFDDA